MMTRSSIFDQTGSVFRILTWLIPLMLTGPDNAIGSDACQSGGFFGVRTVILKNSSGFHTIIHVPNCYFLRKNSRDNGPVRTKFFRLNLSYPTFKPLHKNPTLSSRKNYIFVDLSSSKKTNSTIFLHKYYFRWKNPKLTRYGIHELEFDRNTPISKTMKSIRRLFHYENSDNIPDTLIICNKEPIHLSRCRATFWNNKNNKSIMVKVNFSFYHFSNWKSIIKKLHNTTRQFLM